MPHKATPPCPMLILDEPQCVLFLPGQPSCLQRDPQKIQAFLYAHKGPLVTLLHTPALETLENHISVKETLWQKHTRAPKELRAKAKNHYHTLEGVGWMNLYRHGLGSPASVGETLSLYLLAHVPTSAWLGEWLNHLNHCPAHQQLITPLPIAFSTLAQSLGIPPFTKVNKTPKHLDIIYVPLPLLQRAFLLVTLQGSYVYSRYISQPPPTPQALQTLFEETARHYDKYPGVRNCAPRFWVTDHPFETALPAQWHTIEPLKESNFLKAMAETKRWRKTSLALRFSLLQFHQKMDIYVYFTKLATLILGLLALPYLAYMGWQGQDLYHSIKQTRQELATLDADLRRLPPTSKEKIAFMEKMHQVQDALGNFQKNKKKAAPIAMLPKLAQSLKSSWRAQELQWQSSPRHQSVNLTVRYVGAVADQEAIMIDFAHLRADLQGFFPGAQVSITEAPFEGDVSRAASLDDLQRLEGTPLITGKLHLTGDLL